MSQLFVHLAMFRLLSPLVSGTLVYVFILLFNNSVDQLQNEFLYKEWLMCVGLSYLIQEFARFSLLLFERLQRPASEWVRLFIQVIFSLLLCVGLVSAFMYTYYHFVLGFSPSRRELLIFNSIFSSITLIYISLYLSHQFLYKVNSRRIQAELSVKAALEKDFRQFKQGIHPALLFTSLESLIVLVHRDSEQANDLIGHLSVVYRYILAERHTELVSFQTEYQMLEELVQLFNFLPFRAIQLVQPDHIDTWVVPGVLLYSVEQVVRTTIASPQAHLELHLQENGDYIDISYQPNEKLTSSLGQAHLANIQESYAVYSDRAIQIDVQENHQRIRIPKLTLS